MEEPNLMMQSVSQAIGEVKNYYAGNGNKSNKIESKVSFETEVVK